MPIQENGNKSIVSKSYGRSNQNKLSPKEAIAAVKEYRQRGWRAFPLPVGQKKPDHEKGWQKAAEVVTDDNLEQQWANGENVGVILDAPIVDIDLDCQEAVDVAPYFLPPTPFKFGRGGNFTHWVYECTEAESDTFIDAIERQKRRDGDDQAKDMIVEVRHQNGYSMFPPSVHPSGHQLKFAPNSGWPEAVAFKDLYRRVEVIAAVALMVRYWPGPGARNEATLALCGGLVRAEREDRINSRAVDEIVKAIVECGGNSDPVSDFKAVERTRDTFSKIDGGNDKKKVKGWASLAKILGANGDYIIKQFCEWLRIAPAKPKSAPIGLLSAPFADKIKQGMNNNKVEPHKNAWNVHVILQEDENLRDRDGNLVFFLDERTHEFMVRENVWERLLDSPDNMQRTYPRRIEDADYVRLSSYIVKQWDWNISIQLAENGIKMLAQEYPRNLLREEMLSWRTSDRGLLEQFMGEGEGAIVQVVRRDNLTEDEFKAYCWAVTKLIFLGGAKRTLQPGALMDNVPIFEGKQGIGKTKLCRIIGLGNEADEDDAGYFTTFEGNLGNLKKDDQQKIVGKLIIELSELETMGRSSVNHFKAFVSATSMNFRPPYGRETIKYKKTWVCIGTTNSDGYLQDTTGNRRMWPIEIKRIDIERIKAAVKGMWGEAVDRCLAGEQHWPTDAERQLGVVEQLARQDAGSFVGTLEAYLDRHEGFIPTDMCRHLLGIEASRTDAKVGGEMRKAMISLGWKGARRTVFGMKPNGFVKRIDLPQDTPVNQVPLLGVQRTRDTQGNVHCTVVSVRDDLHYRQLVTGDDSAGRGGLIDGDESGLSGSSDGDDKIPF